MYRKVIASYLIIAVFALTLASTSGAGLVTSENLLTPSTAKATSLGEIQTALETKLVSSRLAQLGFTTDEINSRLGRLSQEQLHALSQDIDQIRSGGNAVVGALLLVFLIILILDLAGQTSYIIKK
ncbi:hypothetical protein LCGC14_2663330 [marine sediment metagenome]|uniref:PA2779 family protein n=1 Tax=marine sediment metagenome TaxID=412755 RepID=A0A0F8ZRC5_9ZZZZ